MPVRKVVDRHLVSGVGAGRSAHGVLSGGPHLRLVRSARRVCLLDLVRGPTHSDGECLREAKAAAPRFFFDGEYPDIYTFHEQVQGPNQPVVSRWKRTAP